MGWMYNFGWEKVNGYIIVLNNFHMKNREGGGRKAYRCDGLDFGVVGCKCRTVRQLAQVCVRWRG